MTVHHRISWKTLAVLAACTAVFVGLGAAAAFAAPQLNRFDDTDARIFYNGSWATYAGDYYMGTLQNTRGQGNGFTVTFTGTQVDLLCLTGPIYGTANWSIDSGAETGSFSLYSASYVQQVVEPVASGLASGTHTLTVTVSGNDAIDLDAIDVDGALTQPPVVSTVGLIQETDAGITYLPSPGAWTSYTGPYSGGTLRNIRQSGAGFSYDFTGTQVELIALTGPIYGTANWSIDSGAETGSFSLYSDGYVPQVPFILAGGLSSGSHTLTVMAASADDAIDLDAIGVWGPSAGMHAATLSSTPAAIHIQGTSYSTMACTDCHSADLQVEHAAEGCTNCHTPQGVVASFLEPSGVWDNTCTQCHTTEATAFHGTSGTAINTAHTLVGADPEGCFDGGTSCHSGTDANGLVDVAAIHNAAISSSGAPAGPGCGICHGSSALTAAPTNDCYAAGCHSLSDNHPAGFPVAEPYAHISDNHFFAPSHDNPASCFVAGCHPDDVVAIHSQDISGASGTAPNCGACHGAGQSPSNVCYGCHTDATLPTIHLGIVADWTPGTLAANGHVAELACSDCHAISGVKACADCHGTSAVGSYAGAGTVLETSSYGVNFSSGAMVTRSDGSTYTPTDVSAEFNAMNASRHNVSDSSGGATAIGMKSRFDGSQGGVVLLDTNGQTVETTWAVPTVDVFWSQPASNGVAPRMASGVATPTLASGGDVTSLGPDSPITCEDCHTTPSNSVGPHGSSAAWLTDPNFPGPYDMAILSSTAVATNTSGMAERVNKTNTSPLVAASIGATDAVICAKCHKLFNSGTGNSGFSNTPHGTHHPNAVTGMANCVSCHIAVPHGWKRPRLLLDAHLDTAPYLDPLAGMYANGATNTVTNSTAMGHIDVTDDHLLNSSVVATQGYAVWTEADCVACGQHNETSLSSPLGAGLVIDAAHRAEVTFSITTTQASTFNLVALTGPIYGQVGVNINGTIYPNIDLSSTNYTDDVYIPLAGGASLPATATKVYLSFTGSPGANGSWDAIDVEAMQVVGSTVTTMVPYTSSSFVFNAISATTSAHYHWLWTKYANGYGPTAAGLENAEGGNSGYMR